MRKKGAYTISQSIVDALESLPWDEPWYCYEFFNLCRMNLVNHGNLAKPYDSTLQRGMRRVRHIYNVVCINNDKSIYMKRSKENNERI